MGLPDRVESAGTAGNTDFSARLVVATPVATLAGRWRCCGVGRMLLRKSSVQCRRSTAILSSAIWPGEGKAR
ncbi:hypothetical protein Hsero_3431 [Herbaspirillum seropedicae SmR1]|uniref:Uncharacterized protein n=1 Tax=Herbaspirillum seropedicae (strain SmR1) TaxID=757424 RepID=D8IPL4_HERSS|nr:hypothetical protein Hsero_3431 [Herbaspirillum seropedicae SmR1]AON55694.1 hypothetical protein Hsc_3427 [Herbaspirillum seropedicae]